jgi:uracil-DNA glycosylase
MSIREPIEFDLPPGDPNAEVFRQGTRIGATVQLAREGRGGQVSVEIFVALDYPDRDHPLTAEEIASCIVYVGEELATPPRGT